MTVSPTARPRPEPSRPRGWMRWRLSPRESSRRKSCRATELPRSTRHTPSNTTRRWRWCRHPRTLCRLRRRACRRRACRRRLTASRLRSWPPRRRFTTSPRRVGAKSRWRRGRGSPLGPTPPPSSASSGRWALAGLLEPTLLGRRGSARFRTHHALYFRTHHALFARGPSVPCLHRA